MGNFNIDYESERSMPAIFSVYIQVVYKLTHLGGVLLDHVYVKEAVLKQFTVTSQIMMPFNLKFQIKMLIFILKNEEHQIRVSL